MSTSVTYVWCLLVGPARKVNGRPFRVTVEQHPGQIEDLKIAVKALEPKYLELISEPNILIQRVRDSSALTFNDYTQDKVDDLFNGDGLEILEEYVGIKDMGLRNSEVLIVEFGSDPTPRHYRYLVMKAYQQGVVTGEDLQLSNIIEELNLNSSIQAFEKRLNRPRCVDRDAAMRDIITAQVALARPTSVLRNVGKAKSKRQESATSDSNKVLRGSANNAGLNDNAPPASNDIAMSLPDLNPKVDGDTCSSAELQHVQTVLSTNYSTTYEKRSNSNTKPCYNETYANAAIFHPFAFAIRTIPNFTFQFARYSWPISLFIEVSQQVYSYTPKSDFLLQHGGSIRFIAGIQSVPSRLDRNRMLLQAACFVKFANSQFKKYMEKKNFCLVAEENDPNQVKYTSPKIFCLNIKAELVEFLRELYNLVSWAAATETMDDVEDSLAKVLSLGTESQKFAKDPRVNAWTVIKAGTCNELHGHGGSVMPLPSPHQLKTTDTGDEYVGQIEAQGLQVVRPVVQDGSGGGAWHLLRKPPSSNIWIVYKQSDVLKMNPLIAKRVSKSSLRELEILQYLHAKPSPSPYIIALAGHFAVGTEKYLIFPQMNRADEDSLHNKRIKQPCQSLVKGVAYLHTNRVAHLDLKLDNLLYDASGQLKIIDFDIAVLVQDEEEKIEGYRGTPGWTAPEIGHKDGPKQIYSAIRADRDVDIFWDLGSCPVPTNTPGYTVVNQVRKLALRLGIVKSFKAYLSVFDDSNDQALTPRSELQSSGVSLTDVPGKQEIVDMLIVDMLVHAFDRNSQNDSSVIVLIAGDPPFSYLLSILRKRNYRVVVLGPGGDPDDYLDNSASLASQANSWLDWNTEIMDNIRADIPRPTAAEANSDSLTTEKLNPTPDTGSERPSESKEKRASTKDEDTLEGMQSGRNHKTKLKSTVEVVAEDSSGTVFNGAQQQQSALRISETLTAMLEPYNIQAKRWAKRRPRTTRWNVFTVYAATPNTSASRIKFYSWSSWSCS
ncbi:hypothetical protein H1R20_g7009, partial [Candolleomyces eurysporus]